MENDKDIAIVAQTASRLQQRLYQLTSTWIGAPVEVHRLQETVSRAFTILQGSVHSKSETSLYSSNSGWDRNRRPVYEQLSSHLVIAREALGDLVDILESIQPSSHQDLAEINRRWSLRREEVALLRLRLGDCIHHILTELSLLNIAVFTSIQTQGEGDEDVYPGDSSARRAMASREERSMERDFDVKFRHVDFTELVRRVNDAHGETIQDRADEKYLAQDEKSVRLAGEEQKSFSRSHLELKSPESLREARVLHPSTPGGQQIPRHEQNEEEFQHLERVFQMISPFESQDADWMTTDHSTELIHSPFLQNRHYSKRHSSLVGKRPRYERLVPALRSPAFQEACPPSCACVCHSQTNTGRGALSAFKTALGSFTFIFNTRYPSVSCNVSTCVSRRGQYLQIIYSFPAWLFHAAISATVKDWAMGSPELLLRVHRRIDATMMSTYTSIFGYITRGDVDNVKRVLARREASVYDVAGVAGVSLLYHALRLREMDVVELLLCEGADVFQLDDAGLGPYHEAIQVMYTSASTPFLDRLQGVLPMDQIIEAAQLTSLHKIAMGILWSSVDHYVAANGPSDVNAGDSNSQTPLFYASAQGNTAVVKALLQAGASPDGLPKDLPSPAPPAALQSSTPLSMAARNGHLDVVQQLLGAGAQANLRSKHNRTALHECSPTRGDYSLQDTFVDIAACLLAHGADLDVVDNYTSTVLDSMCIRDHARVAAFFIERGIDTTHRDWEGSNALANCICFNSLACAALLLGLGHARSGVANVDDNGSSTLHYAATAASVEMMELLAGSGLCGLDAERKDSQGRTARDVFEARSGVTDELRDAFMRLLRIMSRPESAETGRQDSDSDSESAEFFDADESRS